MYNLVQIIFSEPKKANQPTLRESSTSRILIHWNPVQEGPVLKYYDIQWRIFGRLEEAGNKSTAQTSATATRLRSNTAYTFTINARNVAGKGERSDETTFTTSKL